MSTFTIPPLIALLWGITNPYIKRGSELHKPYTKLAVPLLFLPKAHAN